MVGIVQPTLRGATLGVGRGRVEFRWSFSVGTGAKAGGLRTTLYSNSLLRVMFSIFIASWLAQSLGDWRVFNADQREHDEATVS